MTGLVVFLLAVLTVWMLACAACGFRVQIKRFLAVLVIGLALNMLWMRIGLKAHPLEINALIAQFSLVMYGICAFGFGWFVGRLRRRWQNSKVDETGV